jgi:hypothetical protein
VPWYEKKPVTDPDLERVQMRGKLNQKINNTGIHEKKYS